MASELLSCPFCGDDACPVASGGAFSIRCVACNAASGLWTNNDAGRRAAADAWNTRATAPTDAALREDFCAKALRWHRLCGEASHDVVNRAWLDALAALDALRARVDDDDAP